MITPWTIYFISILDSIIGSCIVLSLIGACYLTIAGLHYNFYQEKFPYIPQVIGVIICSILLSTFIPSSKAAAAMIIIPAITNNENIQNISNNTLSSLRFLTNEWVKELASNKDK